MSTYNFQKKTSDNISYVYVFSDETENNHNITFNKSNNYLGNKSGATHEIIWAIDSIKQGIIFESNSSDTNFYKYKDTLLAIIDAYLKEMSANHLTNYIKADFYPYDNNAITKRNIAQSSLVKIYGVNNVWITNNILYIMKLAT